MKKALVITLVFYFLQGLIHNLGHPVTPTLVSNLGIEDYMFGVFFASMSLGLMVSGPIWGHLGDVNGKKKYIVFGLLVYSAGQFLFAFSGNQYWMIVFRFMSGFGVGASVTLLLTHLICLAGKENRTKYIAYSVALMGLGATISYYIGGWMGMYFIEEVFYIQALVNIIYVIGIMIFMKENYKERELVKSSRRNVLQGFKDIGKLNTTLLIFLFSLTLISIGAINLSKYLDVYFISLGYTTKELGTFVMWTGWVGIATNFVVVPYILKLKKDMTIMIIIQAISAVVVVLVFRSNEVIITLYTVYMIYIIIKSVYQPLEQNYISTHAEDEKYGTIMGIRQSFFAVGMVIGPLVGGYLYDKNPLYVFYFSALMFVCGFIMLIFVKNRIKKEF